MSRMRDMVGWVLSVPLSLLFFAVGVAKFRSPRWQMMFSGWGYPDWFLVTVGALEVALAIMLWVPPARRWAALALAVLMLGAAYTHLVNGEAPRIAVNMVLAGLLILVALRRVRSKGPGAEVT